MKKYEATLSSGIIHEVEIARQTRHFVVFAGGVRQGKETEYRERMQTEYNSYHDTKAEAKAWLVEKAQLKVISLKGRLKYAQDVLDTINDIEV